MSLLDRFIQGEIALDNIESRASDVMTLSDLIDSLYPNISERYSPTYYYPSLISFYDDHPEDQVSFYNVDAKSWDGYRKYTHYNFPKGALYRADEILDDIHTCEIDEDDILQVLNS